MATANPATTRPGHTLEDVLVEPEWLEARLDDPMLRVIEVDVSAVAYDEGHIDGAVLWNVYRELKDTNYQLVDKTAIEQLVSRSGITPRSKVVFYGYAPALGFWLMKLYGHPDVGILDCGRGAWRDTGRPWTADVTTPAATMEMRSVMLKEGRIVHAEGADGTRFGVVDAGGEEGALGPIEGHPARLLWLVGVVHDELEEAALVDPVVIGDDRVVQLHLGEIRHEELHHAARVELGQRLARHALLLPHRHRKGWSSG
jgi:hypothetical protein